VGRLLGDPEVWDDSPARPRPAVRGLVGLATGAVAGLLLAFAVVPRPDPPPPQIRLPPAAEAPRLQVQRQVLYSAGLGGGPMLVSRSGRLEQVEVDGTERRVVAQNLRASAVVGPDRAGVLVAMDSGVVTRVEANGTTRRLGPDGFVAGGLAGAGRRLLACPDPAGQPADASLLLDAVSGRASPVRLGCPVAWAAGGGVFAGSGGPWTRLAGFRPATAVARGGSVLVGRPGRRPRVVLDARRLRAAAGKGAVVDGLALSPDGRLVAVSAGRPGRPWLVLVVGTGGRQLASIPLADGHRPAWMGWSDRQGSTTLAVAAVDRRGDLATAELAARQGTGYVLAWQPTDRSARVLTSGVPMVAADGFAWSSDGDSVAVSSPAGVLVVKQADVVYTTASPVTGTLLAWPAEAAP
jgi:sugar lactone lactonase YvrE